MKQIKLTDWYYNYNYLFFKCLACLFKSKSQIIQTGNEYKFPVYVRTFDIRYIKLKCTIQMQKLEKL